MRLRYLHLSHYPPIKDMAVRFASGSPLQRECATYRQVAIHRDGLRLQRQVARRGNRRATG